MAVFEIAVVAVLVALNGLFALSELAIVSARRSRLRSLAEQGRRGAARALELASDPGRFLSTVQIGITAVSLAAGAYSGATLTADLEGTLIARGVPDGMAGWLSLIGVFAAITYVSLIIGELVPKNLALRHAEGIACLVAPLMSSLSRVAAPAVWLLHASTKVVLFLMRQKTPRRSTVRRAGSSGRAPGGRPAAGRPRSADARRFPEHRPTRPTSTGSILPLPRSRPLPASSPPSIPACRSARARPIP